MDRVRRTLTAMVLVGAAAIASTAAAQLDPDSAIVAGRAYPLHPFPLSGRPDCASPLVLPDGREIVLLRVRDHRFTLADVSPWDAEERERQTRVDAADFPSLARTGLHDPAELAATRTITGRSLAQITELGRPGGLSIDGFLAEDEDILSVLTGDNAMVGELGLTHSELARPLFHVWNLMQLDLRYGRWIMPEHRWGQVRELHYHGVVVSLEAHDTKGGQLSIFADSLTGAFWIEIGRDLDPYEEAWLRARYGHLSAGRWDRLVDRLTHIRTGEMEPYYIQWYGFYEGHTAWRTDPVALAWIFGLRRLREIEAAFPGRLEEVLTAHHARAE